MARTLDFAKQEVEEMLGMAPADSVFLALCRSARMAGPKWAEEYAVLKLALADLTGNAGYLP